MCVGRLLGSPTTIHVHSSITSMVRTPLTMPMWLDCQSHTGLRMDAAIFGHMLEGTRKVDHMNVTVRAANPGVSAPPFVGQDLYCESATRYPPRSPRRWYTNNTLWDGEDCYPGSSCCNNALAPWFRRTLQEKTTEDIEVRWCTGQGLTFDRVATELLELYIY